MDCSSDVCSSYLDDGTAANVHIAAHLGTGTDVNVILYDRCFIDAYLAATQRDLLHDDDALADLRFRMDDDAVGVRHDDFAVSEVAEDVAIEQYLVQPSNDRHMMPAKEQQQPGRGLMGVWSVYPAHAMLDRKSTRLNSSP